MLWQSSELVLLLVSLAGILAAAEVGFRLGLRRSELSGDTDRAHVSTLQSALLGMLALLLVTVITVILDIDRPRRGFVTVPQESLIRLQASMERDSQ